MANLLPTSGPLVATAARVDGVILDNTLNVANSASFMSAATLGTLVDQVIFASGPTTSPASIGQCVLIVTNGTVTNVIYAFTIANTANIVQAIFSTPFYMPTGFSLKGAVRTQLTSGATIHITALGRDVTQMNP